MALEEAGDVTELDDASVFSSWLVVHKLVTYMYLFFHVHNVHLNVIKILFIHQLTH